MSISSHSFLRSIRTLIAVASVALFSMAAVAAEPTTPAKPKNLLVPGTGQIAIQVGDDFEEEDWEYHANAPKSSENVDEIQRLPGGISKNGRFYEGILRGQPCVVKRVETPAGGLPDSKGSLLLRSLWTGTPGHPSYHMQQDDFIVDIENRLGGAIPVNQQPSFVTRVFLPPVSQWERRTGPHFAVRTACDTMAYTTESKGRKFGREVYYPGMFLEFVRKEDSGLKYDTAHIRIRADQIGADYKGPQIEKTGWWTFGMSFTRDGMIHFFAKPGIEDLTAEDHLASHYSYGYRCQRFKTFFFNVCNGDNGRTWSTPWIIDDSRMFFIPTEVASKKK
ncbi:MAG: hypothetical protein RIS70_2731 [Planctomycetota bacterium]|jgi:hypothetical protein